MIKVIDAHCGAGKTSWVINYINSNLNKKYIYCSPLLSELERMVNSTNVNFIQPDFNGHTKTEHFNQLLSEGKNIALTHSCFANSTSKTLQLLKDNNYILILDEEINVLEKCEGSQKQQADDIAYLLSKKSVTVDQYGHVHWIDADGGEFRYADIEQLARNNNLIYIDGRVLYWQFPPAIFAALSDVFVLTYQFTNSIMDYYLQYHNIGYQLLSVGKTNGIYQLTEFDPDLEWVHSQRGLINICQNDRLNNYLGTSLNKTWYGKKSSNIEQVKKNMKNYFAHITKAKSKDVMWTAYKGQMSIKSYNVAYPITKEQRKQLTATQLQKLETKNSCFVACNCRATNDYRDRSVLAYAINLYCSPDYEHYFSKRGITINQDRFALANMLQWIYRSQIRDGKPIDIYIPSKRMRDLLIGWMQ